MPTRESVLRAHQALQAAAGNTCGSDCSICHPGNGTDRKQEEVARMDPKDEPKFSEIQHAALVSDAVTRETASLTAANGELETQVASLNSEVTTLQTRVDVLEAEKASLEESVETEKKALVDYKAELETQAAREVAKADRIARIKAAAPSLPEGYTADETRQARWAQMADEDFEGLVESLTETAKAGGSAPKGVKQEDWDGMSDDAKSKWLANQKASEDAAAAAAGGGTTATQTAAFSGGAAPAAGGAAGSRLSQLLAVSGKGPKVNV